MDINLKVTPEAVDDMTWEQWEVFTSGTEAFSFQKARDVIAMFLVDEQGNRIDHATAYAKLGKLKTKQITQVISELGKGLQVFQSGNINPPKGGA